MAQRTRKSANPASIIDEQPSARYALIDCKCGWRTEQQIQNHRSAEVIANAHEARDVRRPYRHETTITLREGR